MPQLQLLIKHIRGTDPGGNWKLALELRNSTWYADQTMQFAKDNNLIIVLQDIPSSATPLDYAYLTDTVYLRFHGPGGKYRGNYAEDILAEYAGYIREWQDDKKTVYVYFNNTMGEAVRNLTR